MCSHLPLGAVSGAPALGRVYLLELSTLFDVLGVVTLAVLLHTAFINVGIPLGMLALQAFTAPHV